MATETQPTGSDLEDGGGASGAATGPPSPGGDDGDSPSSTIIDRVPAWVIAALAIALVGAYLALMVLTWVSADGASDVVWTRRLVAYEGLEAIVAAVIGGIFGATPSLLRAKKAEERAAEKDSEAADNAARAVEAKANGQALRDSIAAMAGVGGTGDVVAVPLERLRSIVEAPQGSFDVTEFTGTEAADNSLAYLERLANQLFPEDR